MTRQADIDVGDKYLSPTFANDILAACPGYIAYSAFGPGRPVHLEFTDDTEDTAIDAAILAAINHKPTAPEPIPEPAEVIIKALKTRIEQLEADMLEIKKTRVRAIKAEQS